MKYLSFIFLFAFSAGAVVFLVRVSALLIKQQFMHCVGWTHTRTHTADYFSNIPKREVFMALLGIECMSRERLYRENG